MAIAPIPAASRQETPPTTSPPRGLTCSETHPRIGPPSGVLPRNATVQRAITLPRNRGSEVSWRVVLPTARKPTLVAPTTASAAIATAIVGAAAVARMAAPNRAAATVRGRSPVLPWPATHSPPTTAPAPMADVSRP